MTNGSEAKPTHFMGCAQIYHLRWYVRSPRGLADSVATHRAGVKRGNDLSPSVAVPPTLLCTSRKEAIKEPIAAFQEVFRLLPYTLLKGGGAYE